MGRKRLRLSSCSFGWACAASCVVVWSGGAAALGGNVDLPRFPSMSPDGEQIAFSWRGDLWRAPAEGGEATRLTSHPAIESRSAWSPDGSRLAFVSDRSGWDQLYTINADGTGLRRVTAEDYSVELSGWTRDGSGLLFSARREGDVYRASRPYVVDAAGGPIERVHDAFGSWPVESAVGDSVLFTRGGSPWWRRHYRGPDARDVWRFNRSDGTFERLTEWSGNDGRTRAADDGSVFFLSDRELDTVNVYRMGPDASAGEARRLTAFEGRDVQGYDVSADGSRAVAVVWDRMYLVDAASPNGRPRAITVTAADDALSDEELVNVRGEAEEAALSPDGTVVAFVAEGDVFVRHTEEGSPTRRVTATPARERHPAWSPDGLSLYFTSDRDGTDSIYAAAVELTRGEVAERYEAAVEGDGEARDAPIDGPARDEDEEEAAGEDEGEDGEGEDDDPHPAERWRDALRFATRVVVATDANEMNPTPSPDGEHLAFRRTRGDVVILDLESGTEELFLPSWDMWSDFRWSHDGRYIAYAVQDSDYNADVWVAAVDGSFDPVNISRHPGTDTSPRWSEDGKILAFLSDRVADEYDVFRVHLDRELDGLSDLDRKEYYEGRAEASKDREPLDAPGEGDDAEADADEGAAEETEPPFTVAELEDAYRRLERVTSYAGSEGDLELTPAADRFVFTASGGAGGDGGVFSVAWDGDDQERLAGGGDVEGLSLDGSTVVILDDGAAHLVPVGGGETETVGIDHDVVIDLRERYTQMFREAMRTLGDRFYHPTMKGLDWASLTEAYGELAGRVRVWDEFQHVSMRMLGELNASHLGAYGGGGDRPTEPNGRLGIDAEPVEGGFRVRRVLPFGPAGTGPMRLEAGDVITAVNFEPVGTDRTLLAALKGTIGEETVVTVRRDAPDAEGGEELHLLLTPVSSGAERALRYEDWQRHNKRLVEEASGGRIGYLHIRAMGANDLIEFERDLYAAAYGKEGLLIDVRNNGGGWTTDRVLASIMVRPHSYTIARGDEESGLENYPQGRLFIQRYTRPVNMLCNEKSFSNAEIVSHAFKTLERGTLVGQQTYGGVISTGGFRLVDGTWVRLPFRGWYVMDGTDMENNGAMPDIVVPQTPADESSEEPYGRDRQLEAAVEDLLERL